MRRLALDSIQVDTTCKKDVNIKSTLQLASEYRGNVLNGQVYPIRYENVGENVFYYDGDKYTLEGTVIKKNGEVILRVTDSKHLSMEPLGRLPLKTNDGSTMISGSTIIYNFAYGDEMSGTIDNVNCPYDYQLCASMTDSDTAWITLFPTGTPVSTKNILSWQVKRGVGAIKQDTYYLNPRHELITVLTGYVTVHNKTILTVFPKEFYMSGDENHVLFTALGTDDYYYSNIVFYNGTDVQFLALNYIMLATDSEGVYHGGFKVRNVNSKWSIDYYNNVPVQVSYNGKVMVNQIEWAAFNDDGSVGVGIKGKYHKLVLVEGLDVDVVADRYIVLNSPNMYYNTYDMLEEKEFCRNPSYNGSLLWLVPEDKLVKDVDKRGTFYVASGINVQGQVLGESVQGTIWPSFPVWGLENNEFAVMDYWSEADSLTPIEVYKGTVKSPTVPEFAFCLGRWKDLKGFIYPDSTNTLYSVTEIDTFTDTYNGVQLVNTPIGKFITAMNNTQTLSFSYYLGTLVELDAVFVLQGTMYGVTSSGYIVSMTVESGAITSTRVVTNSGIMQFIGNTQDMALFYNPYEKWFYTFDSTNKMIAYKEFSVEDIVDFTCRACDNQIVISTPSSLYFFNGTSMYRIESSVNNIRFCKGWLLAGTNAFDSYDGSMRMDVEYDSGRQGSTYDTSVQLDEVDIMLDDSDIKVPPYLEYRIDTDNAIGNVKEITPDCSNIIRIRPTGNRNEGLYYRIWLKTNCNIMGISVIDSAEKKPNLTRNNG